MNGTTHTIGAPREGMTSVSRIPFILTEACYESRYPELASVDLVSLVLNKCADLSCIDKDGQQRPVDGSMPSEELYDVKSLHVYVKRS